MSAQEHRPATIRRKASSSGWRDPTAWTHTINRCELPEVFVYARSYYDKKVNGRWTKVYFDQQWTGPVCRTGYAPTLPSYGSLEDLAVNQALSNLSNQRTDLGQNFAERKQASDMMADRVSSIAHSVRNFKDKRPRDWKKVKLLKGFGIKKLGAIPNAWLETQYGWKPLMSDIKGAYDFMRDLDKDGDSFRVSAKGSRHEENTSLFWDAPDNNATRGNGMLFKAQYRSVTSAGVFVRLDYVMSNPALHQLQQVGLANPAALAWNLVPYSFVLDWVLPVGDYLNSWTADLGLSFKAGTISRFRRVEEKAVAIGPYDKYNRPQGTISPGIRSRTEFTRVVLSSSPSPRVPHFKNPLSLGHFANAMSLLVNVFK